MWILGRSVVNGMLLNTKKSNKLGSESISSIPSYVTATFFTFPIHSLLSVCVFSLCFPNAFRCQVMKNPPPSNSCWRPEYLLDWIPLTFRSWKTKSTWFPLPCTRGKPIPPHLACDVVNWFPWIHVMCGRHAIEINPCFLNKSQLFLFIFVLLLNHK